MIIFALRNPGEKYELTRHNVGAILLERAFPDLLWERDAMTDSLVARSEEGIVFAQTNTFMNGSGKAAAKLLKRFEATPDELVVIHDDLDLLFGTIKISKGRGSGGHNGVKSVTNHLGTPEYVRIRVGIARPEFFSEDGTKKLSVKLLSHSYVLGTFPKEEQESFDMLATRVRDIISSFHTHGLEKTMTTFNQKD